MEFHFDIPLLFQTVKTKEDCIAIQESLQKEIQLKNTFQKGKVQYVAGVDLAYWKEAELEYAVCCIVVVDFFTNKVVEQVHFIGTINFPYIPGCLAFRELPLILETVKKLKIDPDIYMFDGNGYLHPHHMGIATHASIYLQKPTIGVAKSYYKIEETDFDMPQDVECAYTDIIVRDKVLGRALRTHKHVKPIFISAGNYIDLETTTEFVLHCVTEESHIPLPTRLADLETHKWRTFYKQNKTNME